MSDAKMAEYYPPMSDPATFGWRPCLRCGAMINEPYQGLHVDWHEIQKSTERLILDNQPARGNLMDPDGDGSPHGR